MYMIDDQTIDKVVHQLMNDWYDHNKDHKDLARWLINKIDPDVVNAYMKDVKGI